MGLDLTADAVVLADLVRKGEVKPVELLEAAIARAERVNPALNAIILPLYERARERVARTLPEGPLRGVPTTIKDLRSPAAGEPRHDGNRILKEMDFHEDHDCFVVAKLRDAGLVNIGRTNAPEFACGRSPITCENDAHGATRNPWNLEETTMAQPFYLLAQIDVKDYDRYLAEYGFPLLGQLEQAGAEVLVAARDAEILEGEWSGNWTVVIRFPDAATAHSWYESPAYAPLKRARVEELSRGGNVVMVPGPDPTSTDQAL